MYCEGPLYQQSRPTMMASTDMDLQSFPADPLSPFTDSSIDSLLQAISDNSNQQIPVDEFYSSNQVASSVLSSSPPCNKLQSLSLHQTTLLSPLANGYTDLSSLYERPEESYNQAISAQRPEACYNQAMSSCPSYCGAENMVKNMQRSYSSNAFDDYQSGFCFKPLFDTHMEINRPNFHNQKICSVNDSFFTGKMRKVSSTGDLQNIRTSYMTESERSLSSPSATERFFTEEASFKVGRCSEEERKEKILKYKAKRSQRNFNKTIKYACRKTLADSRPRIRGRFARNDEVREIPKAASSNSTGDGDEYEFWQGGLHDEAADGTVGGHFVNNYGLIQYQHYGY